MQIRSRPRLMRKLGVIGAVLCGGLLLGGCTQPDPKPIPTAPPTAAGPVFASDEEALAAAEAGYQAYLDAWNEIAMEGGDDPARILPYVAAEHQAETLEGLAKFTDQSVHNTGEITVRVVRLQEYRDLPASSAEVTVYACLDLRETRIFDVEGNDVTPTNRQDQVPTQARFISSISEPQILVFGGDSIWQAENFCL